MDGLFRGQNAGYLPLHNIKKKRTWLVALAISGIFALYLIFITATTFTHYSRTHNEMDKVSNSTEKGANGILQSTEKTPISILQSTQKSADGNYYPPSNLPKEVNAAARAKAGFVVLVRNRELGPMMNSMRQVESRFNRRFGYPWIFLNEEPFTEEFKVEVGKMTDSEIKFGLIPKEYWSYPDWISQEKAAEERNTSTYMFGHMESYRHMCRYQSGFFFRHPLTLDLDYYWRVEPDIELYCNLEYDPFLFMAMNNKTYGFTMAILELPETVKTLYQTIKDFVHLNPQYVNERAAIDFFTEKPGETDLQNSQWNMCHFWSNFEIGDLRFFRSKEYLEYFDYLDRAGGFFYERWGDAPVHSLAALLLQDKSRLHHFDDIGYRHDHFTHCPVNPAYHEKGRCTCDPKTSFDHDGLSCLDKWWKTADEKEPTYVVPRSRQVGI